MSMSTIAKDETWQEKLVRRFKEEPLVPLGALLTTFTLIMASTKVGRKGQSTSMNRWLRARVIAQGATVAAIVGGSYVYGNTKKQQEAREQANAVAAEELRLKEKQEFEERLRVAEETHALEEQAKTVSKESAKSFWSKWTGSTGQNAQTTSVQTPQLSTPVSASSTPVPTSAEHPPVASTEKTASPSNKRSWFGWGSSSNSGAENSKA